MSEIPDDVMEAAKKACGLCGVTPTSDMRVHAVHVAATAVMADRQRYQWQPIETAPKDGTAIILAVFGEDWLNEAAIMVGEFDGSDFVCMFGIEVHGAAVVSKVICPWTHWHPLPAAPKGE